MFSQDEAHLLGNTVDTHNLLIGRYPFGYLPFFELAIILKTSDMCYNRIR